MTKELNAGELDIFRLLGWEENMRSLVILALFICTIIMLFGAAAQGADWISNNSGSWTDPANWSLNLIPGYGDNVYIDRPGLVTVDFFSSAYLQRLYCSEQLQIHGGVMSLAAESSIYGELLFNGGTIAADGLLNTVGSTTWRGGTLTGWSGINNSGLCYVTNGNSKTLDGTILNNTGIINQIDTTLDFMNYATLYNRPDAIYDIWGDMAFSGTSPTAGEIINSGTFRRSSGLNPITIDMPFHNMHGTVDVWSGSVLFNGGGGFTDGLIKVAAGSSVSLSAPGSPSAPGFLLSGSLNATGAGVVSFGPGSINVLPDSNIFLNLTGTDGFVLATTTLNANGNITTAGASKWSMGSLRGWPGLTNTGTMLVTASATKKIDAGVLNNSGIISHQDGIIEFRNGGVFNNYYNGVYEQQVTFPFSSQSPTDDMINNYGIYRKTSTSATIIPMAFNNIGGTIDIRSGVLTLAGGGTSTGGNVMLSNNSSFIYGGRHTFSAWLGITGIGNAGPQDSQSYLVAAPGANINVNLSGISPGFMIAGTVVTDGSISTYGKSDWSGGTITGRGGFNNSGVMTVSNTTGYLTDAVLNNHGTINQSTAINLTKSSVNNYGNGLYDLISNNINGSPLMDGVFNNWGLFRKSTSSNSSIVSIPFNSIGGTIEVTAGSLSLTRGGNNKGGNINVSPNCMLTLSGNTGFANDTWASGEGSFIIDGGCAIAPDSQLTANMGEGKLRISPAILKTDGILNNTGQAEWMSGTIRGHGGISNSGTFTVMGGMLDAGAINNSGTLVVGTSMQTKNSMITNLSGGIVDIQQSGIDQVFGSRSTVNNYGTIRKTQSNPSSINTALNCYSGTLDIQQGELSLRGGGIFTNSYAMISSGAALRFDAGTYPLSDYYYINGAGQCIISGATLNTKPYGALYISESGLQFNSGMLGGSGLVHVAGDYIQSPSATLLTSYENSGAYGQVNVSNTAYLDGTLKVTAQEGFSFHEGDSHTIMTYSSHQGEFQNLDLPDAGPDLKLKVVYYDNSVQLEVEESRQAAVLPNVPSVKQQQNGDYVEVTGEVTAIFNDCFYIEDYNHIAGVRVTTTLSEMPAYNNAVTVTGTIDSTGSNLTIADADWDYAGQAGSPKAVFIGCKALGGCQLGLQMGVKDGLCLNNIGLLVKTAGKITYYDEYANIAYIDDGSNLYDGNGADVRGVRLIINGGMELEDNVSLKGISVVENVNGEYVRAIRVISIDGQEIPPAP